MKASAVANEPESEREVTITRVYDAPARLLFEAYSKPEHIRKWFGPKGWPVTRCEMDFRVGGSFRFAMTGPSGKQNTPFGGQYREIIPNRKIVYDNGFETKGAGRMLVTVTFDEKDGKTTLSIHTLFIRLPCVSRTCRAASSKAPTRASISSANSWLTWAPESARKKKSGAAFCSRSLIQVTRLSARLTTT